MSDVERILRTVEDPPRGYTFTDWGLDDDGNLRLDGTPYRVSKSRGLWRVYNGDDLAYSFSSLSAAILLASNDAHYSKVEADRLADSTQRTLFNLEDLS